MVRGAKDGEAEAQGGGPDGTRRDLQASRLRHFERWFDDCNHVLPPPKQELLSSTLL